MTLGQLELPLVPVPCPVYSLGVACRYYDGHLTRGYDHTFGGGLGDPVDLRHCPTLEIHPAHAWDSYACSGRPHD